LNAARAIAEGEEPQSGGFLGHPKGLAYLAFTEAWERFSYYGMSALLVLYMVNQLLLPGHIEHVAGFGAFRHAVEGIFGPLSTQALASEIFGLYSAFVYFTPVMGGWLGDRVGQRSAVVLGGLSMTCGHLAMAFDQSFLIALLLLIVGSGLLKGNISAQVGALYPIEEEERRSRGFAIFLSSEGSPEPRACRCHSFSSSGTHKMLNSGSTEENQGIGNWKPPALMSPYCWSQIGRTFCS